MGAKRIGLVTPDTSGVTQRINQIYETLGFEIEAWRADGGNWTYHGLVPLI
jgi:hypothetical protein